jgi:hypothetical protein
MGEEADENIKELKLTGQRLREVVNWTIIPEQTLSNPYQQ